MPRQALPSHPRVRALSLALLAGLCALEVLSGAVQATPASPAFAVSTTRDVHAGADLTNRVCETAPGHSVCSPRAAIHTRHTAEPFPVSGILDPLSVASFIAQGKLTDGASADQFGLSASMTGDGTTIVVGAPNAVVSGNTMQGRAYVFVQQNGSWRTPLLAATLTASDGQALNSFGTSVSISSDGSTIAIGAPYAQIGNNAEQGAVYVYVKPANGWVTNPPFNAKLTASDGASIDLLGLSVAVDGNGAVVVAGAPKQSSPGGAYVYNRGNSGWATQTEFWEMNASDGTTGDGYGARVSIGAATIVVGAVTAKIGNNPQQGAAYVNIPGFVGLQLRYVEVAKLTASNGAALDNFGFAVSISGDGSTVASGVSNAAIGSNLGQGASYVFVKPANGWMSTTQTAILFVSNGGQNDHFGSSIAASADGTVIVVGATGAKAAYVFVKGAGEWSTAGTFDSLLTASDVTASMIFGSAVSVNADARSITVGSPAAGSNPGAVYVFAKPPLLYLPLIRR